jgi:hypothetical protein
MKITEIIPEDEYVTNERIMNICRRVGVPYMKTESVKYRTDPDQISNNGWENSSEVYNIHECSVIATGQSDYNVGTDEVDVLQLPKLKTWFANNVDMTHPKLVAVPLGLPTEKYSPVIGNTRTLYDISTQRPDKRTDKLAYMNFSLHTCYDERKLVFDTFSNKDWVTTETPDDSPEGYKNYLRNVRDHKFCLSPRGNGVDCHRIYECLYLGTIPIVKYSVALQQFSDLPIVFVNEWTDVTPELLETIWNEYVVNIDWNMSKILLSYWKNRIGTCVSEA